MLKRRLIGLVLVLLLAACGDDLEAAGTVGYIGTGSGADTSTDTIPISPDGSGDVGVADPDVGGQPDAGPLAPDVVADVGTPDVGTPDVGTPDVGTPDVDPPEPVCPPGLAGCADGQRLICNEDGSAFELVACEADLLCFQGDCVPCIVDADCGPAESCVSGECDIPPLMLLSQTLPTGLVGAPYASQLVAIGGVPPYTFSTDTILPEALELTAEGLLHGASLEAGVWPVSITVTDDAPFAEGSPGTVQAELTLEVVDGDLVITTASPLPKAVEGEPYSIDLEAEGGEAPYFFGALDPLPTGLAISPSGVIDGIPTVEGLHSFTIKAFDNGLPTLSTGKTFDLEVALAPLQIIGDQELDLFVTKVITLPLIVVVEGLPVPYSAQLQAKGGKKPYHWTEVPLPDLLQTFLSQAGLPDGLTLNADGSITGGVSDTSLAATLTIPFTQIVLSGFFFTGEVADSQDPSETKSAVFIIPTVPIGG
jgi:hypothetical protein